MYISTIIIPLLSTFIQSLHRALFEVQSSLHYEMPILINNEKCGVTAVFDESGNLLNLITVDEEGWSDDNYGDSTNEVLALNN